MVDRVSQEDLLERVNSLEREMERLKRDLLRNLTASPREKWKMDSLFGSVEGADVTEEMIEEAKKSLFRPLEDL
jgi:hypothetical protein